MNDEGVVIVVPLPPHLRGAKRHPGVAMESWRLTGTQPGRWLFLGILRVNEDGIASAS